MRMLRMEAVQKEVLEDVEKTLRIEFMSNLARTSRRDSHDVIAEIFNNLDRGSETRLMAALEERNRESAEKVRALMFTFEDLTQLDPMGMQTLLRAVPREKMPVALKGASDVLRNQFFSNMSERAAKLLKDDIASMGPVRLRDVDEAQMEIVALAKDQAARGEIALSQKKGEDELVY
jgi:flagellar motor switch protein FliG